MPANPWWQLAHSYGYVAGGGLGADMAYEYGPLFEELLLNLSAAFTVDGRNLQATPASMISGGDVFGRFGRPYGVSEMYLPLRHPPWMRTTTRASMVAVESWMTPRLDLGRSDYAAATTTQQRRRREGNSVPLEPEDRCRGPVTRDRRDQL